MQLCIHDPTQNFVAGGLKYTAYNSRAMTHSLLRQQRPEETQQPQPVLVAAGCAISSSSCRLLHAGNVCMLYMCDRNFMLQHPHQPDYSPAGQHEHMRGVTARRTPFLRPPHPPTTTFRKHCTSRTQYKHLAVQAQQKRGWLHDPQRQQRACSIHQPYKCTGRYMWWSKLLPSTVRSNTNRKTTGNVGTNSAHIGKDLLQAQVKRFKNRHA